VFCLTSSNLDTTCKGDGLGAIEGQKATFHVYNGVGFVKHRPPVTPFGWLYEPETPFESSMDLAVDEASAVRIWGTTWFGS
jgi:hypothetical protein